MSTLPSTTCESKQNPPSVNNGCGFTGNSDLYGIGIRLGVYAQWLSALLANHLLRCNREDVHSAYFLFSFALAIGTVVITSNHSGYHCVFFAEIYVLVSLFFGGYFSVHFIPVKMLDFKSRAVDPTPWKRGRLVILLLIYGAMMLYNCWFWFKGRTLGRFQPTPCGTTLFLFGKFSGGNLHKAVGFYEGFSILMAIYYPFGTFFLLQNVPGFQSRLGNVSARYEAVRAVHVASHTYVVPPPALLLISLFCFGLAVVAIELTLLWNSVSGVNSLNSVGQFIPLTVGAGGLVQVLWGIARESWTPLSGVNIGAHARDHGQDPEDSSNQDLHHLNVLEHTTEPSMHSAITIQHSIQPATMSQTSTSPPVAMQNPDGRWR